MMAVKYRQLNSKADCLVVLLERKGRKNSTQDCRNTMLVDSSMVYLLHFFGCVFAQNPFKKYLLTLVMLRALVWFCRVCWVVLSVGSPTRKTTMVTITLPDGSKKEFESAVSVMDIAKSIGSGLAKATLAATVNGVLVDTTYVVDSDSEVSLVTPEDAAGLKLMRHSAAHVMAEAIARVYPGTKFAYGPAIDDGFYYDVDSPEPISADDLKTIEKEMKRIVKKNARFERHELSREEAEAKYAADEYKLDNIAAAKGDTISFYSQGEFEDLCLGPHVPSAGKIGNFKLMSIAGAYWHGDSSKQQLTRVYGTTFATKEELAEHLHRIEEAKKRDHRVIGKQMGLFEFHPKEAQGMAFWRTNGGDSLS